MIGQLQQQTQLEGVRGGERVRASKWARSEAGHTYVF
jgi:hypothetical protein